MGAESMLKPVVVTRAEERDGPLCAELRSLGLTVLVWAAVRVLPADGAALTEVLGRAESFDWIVFTSRHAVAAVTSRLSAPPSGTRTAAVGRATAAVLKQHGWPVDLVPASPAQQALSLHLPCPAPHPVRASFIRELTCFADTRCRPDTARRGGYDRRGLSYGIGGGTRC